MLTRSNRNDYNTLLEASVLTNSEPNAPAIIYIETEKDPVIVSRAEFKAQVVYHAVALQALGIQPQDLVVIAHTQNLESIYAFWGALYAGAIPSMFPTLTEKLDPNIYMNNMAELVRLSGVKAILTTDDFAPTLAERVHCPVYGSSHLSSLRQGTLSLYHPQAEDIAFLQHSSGTTGLQKGVALSHRAVLNQLANYNDSLHLTAKDVVVSWLPLYHDMGLIAGFMLPLVQGIPLVLMSPFDWVKHPALLLKAIDAYKGTLCWLPNFAYNHMARRIRQRDSEGLSLDSMRAFINCSEPVHADSHRQFVERFEANGLRDSMLTVSYAMAENTFAVTQTRLGSLPYQDVIDRVAMQESLQAIPCEATTPTAIVQVSCGQPIYGTQVKVVNEQGEAQPERAIGEIMVKSDCMLTEYYHRPDLNPFDEEGWYKTGDRGYVFNNEVFVIGRSKDLIINAGKNVYPQDLETIVNTIEGVHAGRAVVFGVPDEREGTELIAVVAEVDTDDLELRKQIIQRIRQTIAHQTDVTVNFVKLVEAGWLIKTSSGKLSRGKNRDKWLSEHL